MVETCGASFSQWKVKSNAVDGAAMMEHLYLTEVVLAGLKP